MPKPTNLSEPIEVNFRNGYWPSAASIPPPELQNTVRAGQTVWLRPFGKIEPVKSENFFSATNLGARLFGVNTDRISIDGGMQDGGMRLPYAGCLRYENAVLFFLSELTSQQVFINETAVTGLTTSSTAGRLRVAIPDGVGGYNVYDAGFDKPGTGTVTVTTGGTKAMSGRTGVALVPWRTKTNAKGPPSEITYNDLTPTTADLIKIQLPSMVSGQDGWVYAGTRPRDESGQLKVIRYIYTTIRGTFTATNGNPNLTAGTGTFFTRDLRAGDIVTISGGGGPYTISSVTDNATAVLTANFTGTTGAGQTATITTAAADWYDSERGVIVDLDVQRPPRAAGIFKFGGRVFLWGVSDPANPQPTGNAIIPMLNGNPEHVGGPDFDIATDSGSDLVNVVVGDRTLYLMTTTSLESVSVTGREDVPYVIRTLAEPGFRSATTGCIYKDYFYGYTNRPMRTRVDANIDVTFSQPTWSDMANWDARRVLIAVDPKNEAILYIYDNGNATTTLIPYMTQLNEWGLPFTFGYRFLDWAVVSGELYFTYFNIIALNERILQWEGGAGTQGNFVASQYYDLSALGTLKAIKYIHVAGRCASVSIFTAKPGYAIPDVNDLGQAAATFALAASDQINPVIETNLEASAFALSISLATPNAVFHKASVAGLAVDLPQ